MTLSRQSVLCVVRQSATAAAGLILILHLGSCTRGAAPEAQVQAQGGRGGGRGGDAGAVPVLTAHAVLKAVPVDVTTIGSGEAFTTVEVRAQVTGQLTGVEFTDGQDVEKGQLLFTIDPRPFEVAVQQAQATLQKDIALAKNNEAVRARYDDLNKRGLISQSDYDTAASTAASSAATVEADKAALDSARLQLQYTKIMAPLSGRTGALLVHQGSLVRSTDTTPLVVINQIAPIRVVFAVPGQYLAAIRENQARSPLATEAVPPGAASPSVGQLSFIDNAIDTTTGTIKLKATFPNASRQIWPGALVQVRLRLSVDPHAIVVPTSAIQNGQQGQFVFIVNSDQTVALRPVKVARTNGDDAIVSAGVQAGEEVVTDGQLRLVPGSKISRKADGGKSGS
ncbi:MAG TPA: efflux RND transporter periplasmic adaptor subunit [Vicinamibacterales bacterium]|nr:efflux RND transporter periplasmic adaptor subunit [Vicinamibacterales bacterium]